MDLEKPPDAINSIIKTINPVHQAFSKQNKDYNKYFLSLNLDVLNFMKTLNKITKKKVTSSLFDTLYKKNDTNKFEYEKDILKTFNKLKKMKNNKYIPEDLSDKFKFKFDEINKAKKKNVKNNTKNQRNKSKVNDNFYYGITLDPGRYDPKYNLIFKRIPDVYFDKNKYNILKEDELSTTNINNDQSLKENEIKKENETNKENINKEKNNVEDNFKNKFRKINAKGRNKEQQLIYLSDIDKTRKDNISKIISPNTSINNQNPNIKIFYSSMINFQPNKINKILSPTFHNINLRILNKSHNSSFYPNQNKKNTKIFSSDLQSPNFFHFPPNNYNTYFEEKEKAIINRCKSGKISNIKIFSFNKMKGRKKNLFGGKELSRSSIYNPSYEFVTPKQIKMKIRYEKMQNFKKYAVNKIIRNYYCFSPNNYFIFDINNKKNKTNDKNYIINLKKNYNI